MILVIRSAPSALLVFPLVEKETWGPNFRVAQLAIWTGSH